jgi:hypothetical protein
MLCSSESPDQRKMLELVDCPDILNCFAERFADVYFEGLPSGTRLVQMPTFLRTDLLSGLVLPINISDIPECQRYSYDDIMSSIRAKALGGVDSDIYEFIQEATIDREVGGHLKAILLPDFSIFAEYSWIQTDLTTMLLNRKLRGRDNVVMERLLEIYKCGCLPVGWYGCYPGDVNFLVVAHDRA